MNTYQRAILGLGSAVILLMLLFPPYYNTRSDTGLGHRFVFDDPGLFTRVDSSLLLIQLMGVAGVTAALWAGAKGLGTVSADTDNEDSRTEEPDADIPSVTGRPEQGEDGA